MRSRTGLLCWLAVLLVLTGAAALAARYESERKKPKGPVITETCSWR